MEIIRGLESLKTPLPNSVVTLGNFDGVHLGHQGILRRVREEADRIKGKSVAITFDPHPLKVLAPERCPPLLTPFRTKAMLIEKAGIEILLCIEFTKAFAGISAERFVREVLMERLRPAKIIIGYNYHFGKGKGGNAQALQELGAPCGVEVEVIPALGISDTIVSSSKIRELLREGYVEEASRLLGRDYPIMGKVIEGARRGRLLGFPTANLEISNDLYPRVGVYAVEVIWKGLPFNGVANVGFNPTFSERQEGECRMSPFSLEVHLLDFNKDLYGEEIQVNFRKRIRDEVRFASSSQLIDQIRKDIDWARENVFQGT